MRGRKPALVLDDGVEKLTEDTAPPAWFSAEARAEWDRVTPTLFRRRILTILDLGSLENYCVAVGRVREIEKQLQGPAGRGDLLGTIAPRLDLGLIRAQDKAIGTARQLASEIGITPMSRSRGAVMSDGDDDDLADLDI